MPDNSLEDVDPEFKEGAVVNITGENAEKLYDIEILTRPRVLWSVRRDRRPIFRH
mgnify:CR=1 FL=1